MVQIKMIHYISMRRLLIGLLTFFALLPVQLQAQLTVGAEGMTVKKGTTLSVDGLALVPDADLSLKSLSITRESIPVQWPQFSGIKRQYRFSSPIAYQGSVAMTFLDSELNGNEAQNLVVAHTAAGPGAGYMDYTLSSGSIINSFRKVISQDFAKLTTMTGLTAVTPGSLLVPVTPANATICDGSTITLRTIPGASWQWFRDGMLLPGSVGQELIVSRSGNYTVRVVFESGSSVMSDPASVTVNTALVGNLISERGTSISLGEKTTLVASGGLSYFWEDEEGIVSGMHTDSLVVRPSKNTTYKVVISNGSGCNVVKTIDIAVKDDYRTLLANNILTPNGDGVNDVWVVKNLDLYPNNEVVIFDRAGRVVFKQFDYKNTWDGTLNGVPLPEDTYYYALYINSGKGKLTGFITLVRD